MIYKVRTESPLHLLAYQRDARPEYYEHRTIQTTMNDIVLI